MAHVKIAKVSEFEKKAFEKHGIEIKNPAVEEVEKIISDYLASNNVLHLGTCRNNVPRSTPIEYHSKGMIVYMLSEGGEKIVNMKENPKVSLSVASIYRPLEDFFSAQGLQIWGTAEVCTKSSNPELYQEGLQVIQPERVLKQLGITQLPESYNYKVIKVTPEKAAYNNLRGGFRMITWFSV